jgi:hypothetical protein
MLAADALCGFSGGTGIFRDAPGIVAEGGSGMGANGGSSGMTGSAPSPGASAIYGAQPAADPYPPVDPEACGCSTASARARAR